MYQKLNKQTHLFSVRPPSSNCRCVSTNQICLCLTGNRMYSTYSERIQLNRIRIQAISSCGLNSSENLKKKRLFVCVLSKEWFDFSTKIFAFGVSMLTHGCSFTLRISSVFNWIFGVPLLPPLCLHYGSWHASPFDVGYVCALCVVYVLSLSKLPRVDYTLYQPLCRATHQNHATNRFYE